MDTNRLKTLTIIACKWNARQLNPNDAMLQVWDLFKEENLTTWRNSKCWKEESQSSEQTPIKESEET